MIHAPKRVDLLVCPERSQEFWGLKNSDKHVAGKKVGLSGTSVHKPPLLLRRTAWWQCISRHVQVLDKATEIVHLQQDLSGLGIV
jgi:hypothetical protein